jgi:hypothetical protein
MRMTNKSWENAACGAIERHLFKMMHLNDFEKRKFEDEEAKEIWKMMLNKFIEDYQTFPDEKKQWLIEKLKSERQ